MNNIGACSCGDGSSINNYGLPNCLKGLDVPEDVIFAEMTKVDGTSNGINLLTDTLNQAFFDARFGAVDARERWLIAKGVEDFQSTPADANTFTFPSGRIVKLSEGIRQVVMTFPTKDPYKLKAKFDAMDCRNIGVAYKDRNKSLVGQCEGDLFIFRKIANGSLDVKAFDKTDTEASRVEVMFQYDRSAADRDVDFIEESSMGGYSLDEAVALNDVNLEFVSTTTTAATWKAYLDWGGAKSRTPAGGLEANTDVTADGVVEPTSSQTETVAGTYVSTYSTPLSGGEEIKVRGIGGVSVQLGYDLKRFDNVSSTTV